MSIGKPISTEDALKRLYNGSKDIHVFIDGVWFPAYIGETSGVPEFRDGEKVLSTDASLKWCVISTPSWAKSIIENLPDGMCLRLSSPKNQSSGVWVYTRDDLGIDPTDNSYVYRRMVSKENSSLCVLSVSEFANDMKLIGQYGYRVELVKDTYPPDRESTYGLKLLDGDCSLPRGYMRVEYPVDVWVKVLGAGAFVSVESGLNSCAMFEYPASTIAVFECRTRMDTLGFAGVQRFRWVRRLRDDEISDIRPKLNKLKSHVTSLALRGVVTKPQLEYIFGKESGYPECGLVYRNSGGNVAVVMHPNDGLRALGFYGTHGGVVFLLRHDGSVTYMDLDEINRSATCLGKLNDISEFFINHNKK